MSKPELLKQIADLYFDGVAVLKQEESRRAATRENATSPTRSTESTPVKPARTKRAAKPKDAADDAGPPAQSSSSGENKHPRLMGILIHDYQNWYSKALPVIRRILPERLAEFEDQYRAPSKRKDIDYLSYTIGDFLLGVTVTLGGREVVNPYSTFFTKFQHQLTILYSALERARSSLDNIQGVLQYELFEGEISAAGELLRKGHKRAAGALVGVTLEAHLARVAETRDVKISKKNPTIADLNDPLRNANVIDLPMWRLIQRLADIRNLCAHAKDREPTADEVTDLIGGVKKIIAEVS